jgi:uncharacterized protein YndB with AHSA1/START domain
MDQARTRSNPSSATADNDAYGVATAPGTIRLERLLPGPLDRVWSYLTDSKLRGEWLAPGPMEPRVGGGVELVFRHSTLSDVVEQPPEKYQNAEGMQFKGRVTRWEPPCVLAYTWGESWGDDTEVTFELTPRGEQVLMVLTHRRLVNREAMVSVASGWHTHVGILIDRINGRAPGGFWATHSRLEAEYVKRFPTA